MKLSFNVNFQVKNGEYLQIVIKEKSYNDKVFPMVYSTNGAWKAEVDYYAKNIEYYYHLVNENGISLDQEYAPHLLFFPHNIKEFEIFDVWNLDNFPENFLNTKILQNKLPAFKAEKITLLKKHTHLFRIEAPLYNPNWKVVLLGNATALGNWQYLKTVVMSQTALGVWESAVHIDDQDFIQYKYGILHTISGEVFDIESGGNRFALPNKATGVLQIKSDHFFRFKSNQLYHAAGVAVPVFSLRSEDSFGVGEFRDLKTLADWSKKTNLSVIQILPINDTTANYSFTDSYPYAAISIYALHPQYLALDVLDFKIPEDHLPAFEKEKEKLNALSLVDYELMIAGKWKIINAVFEENETKILADKSFKKFIKENEAWLLPYTAFCVQRDLYKTANFSLWKTHKKYIAGKISPFFNPKNKNYKKATLHAWVQYQLHLQLKDAVEYCHQSGISIKGDLPIGIYRHSVEAWTEPNLFEMDFQAGAPPDQFSESGQNWEFPTYNWEVMQADGYQWWKNRFQALNKYFDAMRIDHILGFFRIWRMPVEATQGILGYFHPALPVTLEEFKSKNLNFNLQRYCNPYINDTILWDLFKENSGAIVEQYLETTSPGQYSFKKEYGTQRRLKNHFEQYPNDEVCAKLISLCANVLFLIENKGEEQVFHPRFSVNRTSSYQYLPEHEKRILDQIYIDYFYNRQEELWYKSAMQKLPAILGSTKMLICGENLGLVPNCVPQVMNRLGIAALQVQRMPSDDQLYHNPKKADYLNVITTSTHDTSTLRQWWKEDRELTQKYFSELLLQRGTAPAEMEPAIGEIILKQHLYNNAMLAIFPIQEYFALDPDLKNHNMEEERINDPSKFPHYWRYRMHISLETLKDSEEFNQKIASLVQDSNRM